jgi:hypothetical protein
VKHDSHNAPPTKEDNSQRFLSVAPDGLRSPNTVRHSRLLSTELLNRSKILPKQLFGLVNPHGIMAFIMAATGQIEGLDHAKDKERRELETGGGGGVQNPQVQEACGELH